MKYAALIGDLVGSRQIENRTLVQQQLDAVLSELNAARAEYALVSPYTITLGDEFQALFSNTHTLWKGIFAIDAALYPVRIRYAIGLGEIHTHIDESKAIGMDGPAFHRAREGMIALKHSGHSLRITGAPACQDIIEPALNLLSHHRDKWRGNRVRIFAGRLAGDRIDTLSETLSISEQAVYQNISDGALDVCQALLDGLSTEMDRTLESGGSEAESDLATTP